jgi:hypothetical protein
VEGEEPEQMGIDEPEEETLPRKRARVDVQSSNRRVQTLD